MTSPRTVGCGRRRPQPRNGEDRQPRPWTRDEPWPAKMERCEVSMWACSARPGSSVNSSSRGLARHPWFRPSWLAASERSEGKAYDAVVPWRLAVPIPEGAIGRMVEACTPGRGPKVVFSALDASVAGEIEQAVCGGGPLRRQQRAQLPDGSAGAVAHSRGQRRPLDAPAGTAAHQRLERRYRDQSQLFDRRSCHGSGAFARLRSPVGDGLDDAGGVGGWISGRAVARYSWERRPVHRRRGREDRIRDTEDSWQERRANSASGCHQCTHQSRRRSSMAI